MDCFRSLCNKRQAMRKNKSATLPECVVQMPLSHFDHHVLFQPQTVFSKLENPWVLLNQIIWASVRAQMSKLEDCKMCPKPL